MELLIILLVVLAVFGALPIYPYSRSWGYYPTGGIGLIALIVILLVVFNYV